MSIDKPISVPAFDYASIASRHSTPKPWLPITARQAGLFFGSLIVFAYLGLEASPVQESIAAQPVESPVQAEVRVSLENTAVHADEKRKSYSVASPENTTETSKTKVAGKFLMERDASGQFSAQGTINHTPVIFRADTGATVVVIPEQTAGRIGLPKGDPILANTAAGPVIHYSTKLETLNLGGIVLHNVTATIAPDMEDGEIVLGMNVLADLHMKTNDRGLELSDYAYVSAGVIEDSHPFNKPLSQCMKPGNQIDRHTLECLHGAG